MPNFVTLLAKKRSCDDLTEADVSDLYKLLSFCAPYYYNFTLGSACAPLPNEKVWYADFQYYTESCPGVPRRCKRHNLVYIVLHYLVDFSFLSQVSAENAKPTLTYTTTFLPIAASEANVELFEHLEHAPHVFHGVEVAGAYFGVKYRLFARHLLADSLWLALGAVFVFAAAWAFTASIFVTLVMFATAFLSVCTAYVVYTYVFRIVFFPYLNMIAVVFLIGLGADDLFVYCRVWHLSKSAKNNGTMEKLMSDTLRHSFFSVLATSLTTAAAFYSNAFSDITSVRCFGIFTGTSIVCSVAWKMTLMPTSVLLYEKWCSCFECEGSSYAENVVGRFHRLLCSFYRTFSDWTRVFFEQILPFVVIRCRYMWLILCVCLAICGFAVVFYYPRLRLPHSRHFQVFGDDHLLEKYDFHLMDQFDFEMLSDEHAYTFPVALVWGVQVTDNGNYLDPHDKGDLLLDNGFNLSSPQSQMWLLQFCTRLRRLDFYLTNSRLDLTNCFLDSFVNRYMQVPCSASFGTSVCCKNTSFPFPRHVFYHCLNLFMRDLYNTPGVYYSADSPGPRFSDGHVTALIVRFHSTERFSFNYHSVGKFYEQINNWIMQELSEAPREMQSGWFVSDLGFYDLQHSLISGLPLSVLVSLGVLSVLSFVATRNVLISVFFMLTVAGIIFVTLGSLVLLGWELNVMESVVFTLAIGMSVDYTLHYAVAYCLADRMERELRVAYSISSIGCAVAMAAVTTFMVGAFVIPSTVLMYHKFGIFLMVVVIIGWFYSTFFFQSLVRTFGPDSTFVQFRFPSFYCCNSATSERTNKAKYTLSPSTTISFSDSYNIGSVGTR